MSDPFLAQIVMFGGNFAPRGWAFCEGQLLPISQYSAVFSLVGTIYGGDGRTTFALPDLRGRVPIHHGNGPGLSPVSLGQKGGRESVTITTAQMPAHNHAFNVVNDAGTTKKPSGTSIAGGAGERFSNEAPSGQLAGTSIANTGGGQAVDVRPPYLAVSYIIALQGTFPSRS